MPGDVCSHDHDCGGEDCGSSSLHPFINHPRITAWNAQDDAAAQRVFRPWCAPDLVPPTHVAPSPRSHLTTDPASVASFVVVQPREDRLSREGEPLRSDGDPELMVHVPFISDVKVRGVMVIGGGSGSAPARLKCWVNKAPGEIDFANANRKTPTQQWDLAEDHDGTLEYQTDFTQFQAVSSLTLHFPTNLNDDGDTEIWFIGLRGEGTINRRDMIVTAVYESRAMPQDHKTPDDENVPCQPAV